MFAHFGPAENDNDIQANIIPSTKAKNHHHMLPHFRELSPVLSTVLEVLGYTNKDCSTKVQKAIELPTRQLLENVVECDSRIPSMISLLHVTLEILIPTRLR